MIKQYRIECAYKDDEFYWGEIVSYTKKEAWHAEEDSDDYTVKDYKDEDSFIEAAFIMQDRGFTRDIP